MISKKITKEKINFKNEILSGLTVALALVPESIALAFVVGVQPLVGLLPITKEIKNVK